VTDYNAQRKGTPVKRGREVDVGPHLGYHDDEAPSEQWARAEGRGWAAVWAQRTGGELKQL